MAHGHDPMKKKFIAIVLGHEGNFGQILRNWTAETFKKSFEQAFPAHEIYFTWDLHGKSRLYTNDTERRSEIIKHYKKTFIILAQEFLKKQKRSTTH
jgi:hypothetical protein